MLAIGPSSQSHDFSLTRAAFQVPQHHDSVQETDKRSNYFCLEDNSLIIINPARRYTKYGHLCRSET